MLGEAPRTAPRCHALLAASIFDYTHMMGRASNDSRLLHKKYTLNSALGYGIGKTYASVVPGEESDAE
eukprot:6207185-Pleurochrysis_carterae.AAC.1